jgi:hypothetical protein
MNLKVIILPGSPGDRNYMTGKLFKDLAVPDLVGLGKVAARNAPAEAEMIRLATVRVQGNYQTPKAITIG